MECLRLESWESLMLLIGIAIFYGVALWQAGKARRLERMLNQKNKSTTKETDSTKA